MGKLKNPLRGDQLTIPGIEAAAPPAPEPAPPKKRPGRPPSIAWKGTQAACQAIGVSRWMLASARDAGELRKGYHWKVKNPAAARLTYLWHVERLEQWQADVMK